MDVDEILQKIVRENSKSVSDEALRLLCKIVENILKDPSNIKLRTLQKNNVTVSKKILPVKGALEFLKLMGFQEQKTYFVLPASLSLTTLEKFKTSIVKWRKLEENNASNSMDVQNNSSNEKSEAIIKKIHLPPLVLTYSNPLLRRVEIFFHNVLQYEDKEVQQRALKLVPLATLEENAQNRLRHIQEHIKKNKGEDPEISIQDTLLLELLQWFKEDFFSWVDSPECSSCGEKTVFSHMSTDSSVLVYTDRVELHRCDTCHKFTPFPRYDDVNILLETRRGRCGEWANTFTLFCRAMGWDARFVVEEGDHVWTEVYSIAQKRWLHCDPCENICDTPLVYETGWKKQISYVIAYSAEEVQDVTWRYCTNHKEVLKRRKQCPETELLNALSGLTSKRQKDFSDSRKKYLAKRLLSELIEFLTEKKPNDDDCKGRSSGAASWRLARGEIQDVEDPLYVWQIKEDDILDNSITIRYSPSLDKYEYISGGTIIREVEKWNNGVFKCSGVFRKEEMDWKMVYLCRKEGRESGNISWRIELLNSSKSIDSVSLDFQYKTYENGVVNTKMSSDDKVVAINNGCENTKEFYGSQVLSISASLSGGKGDVSWQHAQLFRQSIDSEDFPFSLKIIFK
ncbi:peptide-N(4)-(N-acetyl-beta-glucosaminyl)asparagine amidase [Anoplophora glabripennis]|uniref:peptide-N(4)-(N-acetyl-beta- glucosaminyl)asparagine amidase n=1 Tax=Anoplophora glabripennis TaxID=217634 RepID=UPI0008744136|nr:peptide-N(4)-(N-acetyl-beta-glucosaminyl)asparagine amidase [Anoplophora glabripennis]